jgi:hypothetical protein
LTIFGCSRTSPESNRPMMHFKYALISIQTSRYPRARLRSSGNFSADHDDQLAGWTLGPALRVGCSGPGMMPAGRQKAWLAQTPSP